MAEFRYIGKVNGALTTTAGTIACGNARKVNLQVVLDSNSTYEIAVNPVVVNTGTASKNNFTAVVTDNGVYSAYRPAGANPNWWLARRIYNASATGATGGANNKYALEKLDL